MENRERDVYAELLRDTRSLRREHAQARENWFAKLRAERKEETLFELEILLKALACFANPKNHPGPPRRVPMVALDFREPASLAREALTRIMSLCRALLVEKEKQYVFQRYIETVLPDDVARARLVKGAMEQESPPESLFVLRHAMSNLAEVMAGVARLPRVHYRLFYALLAVAQREVSQSVFFNPLSALEFRPEFDRISVPRLLDLTRGVHGEQARRVVALAFLALFRMLRYLALLETSAQAEDRPDDPRGAIYLVLSVLSSDARALTSYFRQRAGPLLADAFEEELFSFPANELSSRYDGLLADGHRLREIKATLDGIAANIRLELRRIFEHEFPTPDSAPSSDEVRAATTSAIMTLRPALQNAILFLGKTLDARLDAHGVWSDATAKRALSERLRRDVWMFGQIVRAFSTKARAVRPGGDVEWQGISPIQFVREFLAYFRAMGYPLLRAGDYPRVHAFIGAMSALEESDLLDPQRLSHATDEADRFYAFLSELFEHIGHRDELAGVAFDRRAAAESLRMYLGS